MAQGRWEEEWARRCISLALGGVEVVLHDDGSRPGMHDLDILYADVPAAAVEVTGAADAESIELWNLMNDGDRWRVNDLAGGWFVQLSPEARGRRILAELPVLLRQLEQVGIASLDIGRRTDTIFDDAVASLSITRLSQGRTEYPGSIYFTIELPSERSGGLIAETANALADWVSAWLQEPAQRGNLDKLRRSGAAERHLSVVLPSFSLAPFDAAYPLMIEDPALPTVPPNLPEEVTHMWCASTWHTGTGMWWAPEVGWQRFDRLLNRDIP